MQPACMSDVSAKLLHTVTVSTSSIVYIKSDFRKPSSLYSLHIKHSHTHTHIRSIPYHSISTTLKPLGFSCNLYHHQYCKYLRLDTNRIP
jgi:hypothetical protein